MNQNDIAGVNRGACSEDAGAGRNETGEGRLNATGVLVSWSDISCHAAHWTGHQTYIQGGIGVKVAQCT